MGLAAGTEAVVTLGTGILGFLPETGKQTGEFLANENRTLAEAPILGSVGQNLGTSAAAFVEDPTVDSGAQAFGAASAAFLTTVSPVSGKKPAPKTKLIKESPKTIEAVVKELHQFKENVNARKSLNDKINQKAVQQQIKNREVVAKDATKGVPKITTPYKRPSGATTQAQRQSVQNKPCVDCGATATRQVADHKTPLVKEYYQTGTIDKIKMRKLEAVQPQCPTCSAKQGADMSRFSRQQKKDLGL